MILRDRQRAGFVHAPAEQACAERISAVYTTNILSGFTPRANTGTELTPEILEILEEFYGTLGPVLEPTWPPNGGRQPTDA